MIRQLLSRRYKSTLTFDVTPKISRSVLLQAPDQKVCGGRDNLNSMYFPKTTLYQNLEYYGVEDCLFFFNRAGFYCIHHFQNEPFQHVQDEIKNAFEEHEYGLQKKEIWILPQPLLTNKLKRIVNIALDIHLGRAIMEVPYYYMCSLLFTRMKNPVISLTDHRYYEESAIQQWFMKYGKFCPYTRKTMDEQSIIPASNLKRAIHALSIPREHRIYYQ